MTNVRLMISCDIKQILLCSGEIREPTMHHVMVAAMVPGLQPRAQCRVNPAQLIGVCGMLNRLPRLEGQWLRIILHTGEANVRIGPMTRAQSHLYPLVLA
jgi:hypothetical protein